MRILVVLLLFLVGGLVLASRFGQSANSPGEVAVREAPAPGQDEAPVLSGEAETSPDESTASSEESGQSGEPNEGGAATATAEEATGAAETTAEEEPTEDETITLRLDDAAGSGPAEPAPDGAPSPSQATGAGPTLEQPVRPGEAPALMPQPASTAENPDEVPPGTAEPEETASDSESVEAPSAPAEPLPAEPLGPEEALAAMDAEGRAALEATPEAGGLEAEPTPGVGDEAPATAATPIPSAGPSPAGAEPSLEGPAQSEVSPPEPTLAESAPAEPPLAEPAPPEPALTESDLAESSLAEPALAESAPAEPPLVEPAPQAEPVPTLPSVPEVALSSVAPEAGIRRMVADRVNLREGPDTDRPVLDVLSLDDEVEVLEAEGDWLRVRSAGGEEGWVAARFVAPGPD